MSVPAEVLQNILLQQQEQLNLIAALTQTFQLQDTGNSDSVDLASTIKEFTYDAENDYTFNAWFTRWHDTFQHEFPSSPLTRRFRNTFPTVSKAGNRRKGDSTIFDS